MNNKYFNKIISKIVFLVFFFLGIFVFGTSSTQAQAIKLKLADSFPISHVLSKEGGMYWANRVTALTKGQVTFEHYPAQQLGKAEDILDLVRNKVADVGYVAPSYVSNKLPLSAVGMLPGASTSSSEGTKAYWKVIEQFLEKEEFLKNGVRPVLAVVHVPYKIMTTKKSIRTVDSLKGLKIRSGGALHELMLMQMGAIPVSTPAPEVYMALQRGTVDGSTGPFSSLKPYKMEELVHYAPSNSNVGTFIVSYCINESLWNTLPDNVKNAMRKAGQETMQHLSKVLDEEELTAQKGLEALNVSIYSWSKEDLIKQKDAATAVTKIWAEKLDKRGLKGTKTVEMFQNALKQ